MKVKYTTKNKQLQLEVEANSTKEVFKHLAEFQEVFEESSCGACASTDIRFQVRTVDSNDFYELRCLSCRSKMVYGQHKTGGSLFPKKKSGQRGWFQWSAQTPDDP